MAKIHFTKMHGAGNSYICIDGFTEKVQDWNDLTRRLCSFNYGIGADSLIAVLPSDKADFQMRIFNADGSEAEMCGNGIRCLGYYAYTHGLTHKKEFTVETLAGIKSLLLNINDKNQLENIRVDMGSFATGTPVDLHLKTGEVLKGISVSFGNPHVVVQVDDPDTFDVHGIGQEIEHLPIFPNRTNVEFIHPVDAINIKARVWERGCGETQACGTGACAIFCATFVQGRCEKNIQYPGGTLKIQMDPTTSTIFMTGPAAIIFAGEIDI